MCWSFWLQVTSLVPLSLACSVADKVQILACADSCLGADLSLAFRFSVFSLFVSLPPPLSRPLFSLSFSVSVLCALVFRFGRYSTPQSLASNSYQSTQATVKQNLAMNVKHSSSLSSPLLPHFSWSPTHIFSSHCLTYHSHIFFLLLPD